MIAWTRAAIPSYVLVHAYPSLLLRVGMREIRIGKAGAFSRSERSEWREKVDFFESYIPVGRVIHRSLCWGFRAVSVVGAPAGSRGF